LFDRLKITKSSLILLFTILLELSIACFIFFQPILVGATEQGRVTASVGEANVQYVGAVTYEGSFSKAASFIIWKSSSTVHATDGLDGSLDYSGIYIVGDPGDVCEKNVICGNMFKGSSHKYCVEEAWSRTVTILQIATNKIKMRMTKPRLNVL